MDLPRRMKALCWTHVCSTTFDHMVSAGLDDGLPRVCWSWYHGLHLVGHPDCRVDMAVLAYDEAMPYGGPRFVTPEEPGDPWLLDYVQRDVAGRMVDNEGFDARPDRSRLSLHTAFVEDMALNPGRVDVDTYLRGRAAAVVLDTMLSCRFAGLVADADAMIEEAAPYVAVELCPVPA